MVGAVKNWQKSDPQKSLDTWRQLSEANTTLEAQLNLLSKLAEEHWETYKGVVYYCSMYQPEKVVYKLLLKIESLFFLFFYMISKTHAA